MGRIYKNPPILEALCEFRFEPSQPWDLTIPGLYYREVESAFPKRRAFNPFQVGFEIEGQGRIVQNLGGGADRVQFVREDERALIQVGPDILAINHLKPYPSWTTFKPMIQRALEVYEQVAKPQAISRIGLRYINRLEIPDQQEIEIEHFLLAVPTIPGGIPQTFGRWMQRVEIPLLEANGLLVVHTGSVIEEGQENIAFLLDLDLSTLQPMSVELDLAMEWVERAHDEIETAFEACITPEARRLFGEEEQHGNEQDDRAQRQ